MCRSWPRDSARGEVCQRTESLPYVAPAFFVDVESTIRCLFKFAVGPNEETETARLDRRLNRQRI